MLSINVSEVILTVLNFFLLYFLLKRFLYTPLVRFMDERQARIDAGRRVKTEAQDAVREHDELMEQLLRQSREDARRLIDEANAAGETARVELRDRLAEEKLAAGREAEERVTAEIDREREELHQQTAALAELLAQKLTA